MAELICPATVGSSFEPSGEKGLGAQREVSNMDKGSKGEAHGSTREQDGL